MKTFLIVAALVVAACGASDSRTVSGVVVGVDGDLTSVVSFTVQTTDGERLEFEPAADGDFEFPLPHLAEHLRTGDPVVVTFEDADGLLIATAVGDG